jgi:hypothetical protein
MPKRTVLADLVNSATAAKVHFEVWWAQANEAKPGLLGQMNTHSDFFRASYDAHYIAYHIYLAHLYDSTPKTASIGTYLKEIKPKTPASTYAALEQEFQDLRNRARPLVIARHKTIAHVDQFLTEKEVFSQADPITYNSIKDLIYDSAQFVAKLAGHENQPGQIGIARDRRLLEATLALIKALR